jgi:peroxiredoxin
VARPPERYRNLLGELEARKSWCPGGELARLQHSFVVPANPGGRSDEPLDLGALELTVFKHVRAGEAAPAFETETVDGEPLRLADFRSEYVLLDFWATWCGPCLGETPHLKKVYEEFGERDDFAMIGLSLDTDREAAREYAEEKDIHWIQGFLGDWSSSAVPDSYGVRGIPSIFLIGPDGRIVAKGLRDERILREVRAQLPNQE